MDPDEMIDCGQGFVEIAGFRINDHNVFDQLRFRDVMAKSSDVGMVRVAQRLGRENFNRYMRGFGFGAPTGVDLPGEAAGLLRPTQRWSALSLASLSFGQEIGVTALQLASAVSAVANGGSLMRPTSCARWRTATGSHPRHPPAACGGCSSRHRRALTASSRRVGERDRASWPPSPVPGGGQDGTAQKIDARGRIDVDHVASFVG